MENQDLLEALDFIDPGSLTYEEWTMVGMGLKQAGFPVTSWEQWSARDGGRYHRGECTRKWGSFHGNANPVTENSIFKLARDHGWAGPAGYALDWNDVIDAPAGRSDGVVVDPHWLGVQELAIPAEWDPADQLVRYLQALFEPEEHVAYVTESYLRDGHPAPTKGCWDRTAGQLIEELRHYGDIHKVVGDCDAAAGAWICFNPVNGGRSNDNVTDYRYALVECDNLELEKQQAIIRQLELPCAALVYSGGKSLHAIVRVNAPDYAEYRKRVDYLYTVCQKNGLTLDQANRNPSRLSRMPGIVRGGQKQYLLGTNLGKNCWEEWRDWVEASNDDLPDTENLADDWGDLPPLADSLIDGVLRQGHKMLLAGPSKAGKSFALIELCICIAEGKQKAVHIQTAPVQRHISTLCACSMQRATTQTAPRYWLRLVSPGRPARPVMRWYLPCWRRSITGISISTAVALQLPNRGHRRPSIPGRTAMARLRRPCCVSP